MLEYLFDLGEHRNCRVDEAPLRFRFFDQLNVHHRPPAIVLIARHLHHLTYYLVDPAFDVVANEVDIGLQTHQELQLIEWDFVLEERVLLDGNFPEPFEGSQFVYLGQISDEVVREVNRLQVGELVDVVDVADRVMG